jgi:hypothetical protein
MSSKSEIYNFLVSKGGETTNTEIAEFMRYKKGSLSWGQRLRDIRKDMKAKGGDLICREIRTGYYLYKLIFPKEEQLEIYK